VQFVNGCAKENTVINFQHILYYRVMVNLVIGIFTVSCAVPCPQMSGHFIGHSSVGMARTWCSNISGNGFVHN